MLDETPRAFQNLFFHFLTLDGPMLLKDFFSSNVPRSLRRRDLAEVNKYKPLTKSRMGFMFVFDAHDKESRFCSVFPARREVWRKFENF